MIIDLYSDLHLDTWRKVLLDSVKPMHFMQSKDADVVVVAGDQGNGQGWSTFCRKLMHQIYGADKKVLMINGNHDWYGPSDADDTVAELLANNAAGRIFDTHDGATFAGCTLWTNFWGELSLGQTVHGTIAARYINDFQRIPGLFYSDWRTMVQMHDSDVAFLRANPADVIITHFPPSLKSVHPEYAGDPLNPYFVNDLDSLVEELQPKLWIHGHTHNLFDYTIGKTRVVANPLGYPDERQSGPYFKPMRIEL